MKRFDLHYSLVNVLIEDLRDKLGEQYALKLKHYTALDTGEEIIKCAIFHKAECKGFLILKFNIEEEYTNKDAANKIRKFINLIKEFVGNDFKWEKIKLTENGVLND